MRAPPAPARRRQSLEERSTEMHTVRCTVESVKGNCAAGYRVGDSFLLKDAFMIEAVQPKTLCLHALAAMSTYLTAYARRTDPADWINFKKELQCPDNDNAVIFRLERLP
jgi:uncharacterized repeat protein (TIGR04076 family)